MNVGQHDCAYARWAGYHAGRHGTGYRSIAQAVPLATGSGVHTGMELIGRWILDWQHAHAGQRLLAVPDEVTAWAAIEAADGYARKAHARGLELTKTDVDAQSAIDRLIQEQRTLIEAQVWIYAIVRLPFMLAQRRLLDVEREETPVIDCTCGLGDWIGDHSHHAARGCRGIVAMGKADFLWETAEDVQTATGSLRKGAIEYEEFKTKATPNYGWEQQWEHSGQLFRNMEAASKRLGKDVTQAYVPVLFKGRRDRRDREDKNSPKEQQSPLVFGYFDPGNGLGRDPEWSARYRWYDDWGKGHTLPRSYQRQPIWDEQFPLVGVNPNGVEFRADASRVERWVRGWILPIQYPELIKVLGPYQKPRAMVADYTQSMLTGERRWRSEVEYARGLGIFEPTDRVEVPDNVDVPTPTDKVPTQIITAADIFERSWACTRFAGDSCFMKPVCHREPGYEQGMLAMGRYEIRTPHHEPEKADAIARGVVFAADDDDEGDDD